MIVVRRPIRPMPPELALKIAAGEVVERPASVVKELIDNAVDAGATHVAIEIRESGLKLIRVADDGCGIPRAELTVAFASHATSKVAELDDLDHLATLGFRGEALAAIAAVSRIDVQSRAADEEIGGVARLEFGKLASESPGSVPRGTRMSVLDLFANVPVRRKFVRSLRAEAGQIQTVVMQYALAQPNIQFSMTMDGRSIFESPGTGRLSDALAAVYGAGTLAETWPVSADNQGIAIDGLISAPSLSRANRSAIHLFVNGRPIQNRSLAFALEEAYSGFLMNGRHPLAAMHLRLSPAEIDPNIHPSKNEVRFSREREIHGAVHRAVATALLAGRLGEQAMRSRSAFELPESPEEVGLPLPPDKSGTLEAEQQPGLLANLPALRIFGQTNGAFIIAEGPHGLYMIDQHAAHERVLFDQLDWEMDTDSVATQPLLEPISVDLEPSQVTALEENRDLLARAGFILEPFGTGACLVRAIPALAKRGEPAELVCEVLTEIENVPESSAARERALAAMACKAAVKAGQALSVDEMREIVTRLERTPRPATCPHGRPTMIHLSHTQLEREFGRR